MNSEKPLFSIETFLSGKHKLHTQLYGKESIDNDGNIISFSDQAAIVTHYMKLKGKEEGGVYEMKGRELVDTWSKWSIGVDESNEGMVSDTLDAYSLNLFQNFNSAPFQPTKNPKFKFIDLFAGIGGFRIAMQDCGGECVYSSEWDENAKQTYFHNFGEVPFGDITKESNKRLIPDGFDVLCAGFPCQAFSIAGYRKGFEDTRGTLFFDVAEIIKRKRPKAIFLENVKNLYTHDEGKT